MQTDSNSKATRRLKGTGSTKFLLKTHRTNQVIVHKLPPPYDLTIDLQLDPENLEYADDKFTLFSTDDKKTYRQTLTIKDDKIVGDEYCTLVFTDLDPSLSYTLHIDCGSMRGSYELLSDIPYPDLKKAEEGEGYLNPEETEEPEEDPREEEGQDNDEQEFLDEDELSDDEETEAYNELLDAPPD